MKSNIVFLALAASSAFAHLEMLVPLPRNVGEMSGPNDQRNFPCAGPNLAPVNRVAFSSLKDSSIVLTFYWDGSNDVYLGFGDNPQTFPYKVGALANAKSGETYTVKLDLSSVPSNLLTQDAKFTVQVVCHQPTFDIYQCADFTNDVVAKPATSDQVQIPTSVPTVIATTIEPPIITSNEPLTTFDAQKTSAAVEPTVAATTTNATAGAAKTTTAAAASSTTSAKASDATAVSAFGLLYTLAFALLF
ncbi:hypothetical protein BDR26DRAFT_893125 [Obelidium mucronatum]|nr:hypothetical protein BDR26DRAFT_893125 [Obelidium mucronatum]